MTAKPAPLPTVSGLIFDFTAPGPFFVCVNLLPLVLWAALDDQWFLIALQGYARAPLTGSSALFWTIYFVSFWIGSRLTGRRIRVDHPLPHPMLMVRLHVLALVLTVASALVIADFFANGGLDALALVTESNANELKIALYSSDPSMQVAIMARHLVLTALITLPFLKHSFGRKVSLILLLVTVIFLAIFTSSRLTAISAVIIWLLSRGLADGGDSLKRALARRVAWALLLVMLLFGAGVASRSAGTWAGLTGSDNMVLNAWAEFLAYYVSPVNYSTAIVNDFDPGSFGLAAVYSIGVVFTVFNLDDPSALAALFHSIAPYYNSSLNQIGLLGQFYSGWGPLFVIPMMAYGYMCQRAYNAYRRGTAVGLLLYPLMFISIFDSFRGFLLCQNILAANWLFVALAITAFHFLRQVLREPARAAVEGSHEGVPH